MAIRIVAIMMNVKTELYAKIVNTIQLEAIAINVDRDFTDHMINSGTTWMRANVCHEYP